MEVRRPFLLESAFSCSRTFFFKRYQPLDGSMGIRNIRLAAPCLLAIMSICLVRAEDADQFARLHALIKPQAQEDQWLEVPWMSSVWEARKKAAAEGKPILLWEMDGHPLGCT